MRTLVKIVLSTCFVATLNSCGSGSHDNTQEASGIKQLSGPYYLLYVNHPYDENPVTKRFYAMNHGTDAAARSACYRKLNYYTGQLGWWTDGSCTYKPG